MKHADFVEAWRTGRVSVEIDRRRAGAFLAARLLLPFVAIAVIGLAIALVLWGWVWLGLALGAIGIIVPRLLKRGAGQFLMAHIAGDPELFESALASGAVRIVAADADAADVARKVRSASGL